VAWRTEYVRRIVLGDVLSGAVAAGLGLVTRFGLDTSPAHIQLAAFWVGCLLPALWPIAMLLARTYEHRYLWVGAEEFRRIFGASMLLVASLGTVSWALKLEVARGFVVVTLPLLALLTLINRFSQRRWQRRERSKGRNRLTVMLVGHAEDVGTLKRQIERKAESGYHVIGACVPLTDRKAPQVVGTVPVLGHLEDVADIARQHQVDAVAVLPCRDLTGDDLRRLGWELEETSADLLLVPAVTEVAGPRVRVRPAFGMSLMHVERPDIASHRGLLKILFDRIVAATAVLLFSPLFIVVFLGVKLTSPGPAFFRHERIGRHARPIHVLKFRTMYQGADKDFEALLDQSEGNSVQFKMHRDPRVTPIGRILRRFSIDELPQLFNVLGGSMSLVGPRPHVQQEVDQYDRDMRRRLAVKPGMTGLWQVSGRSDLSWEASVRIDVRYVDNWSLALDLVILSKTVRAVLNGAGAY
jgi:exopolysaccharide biosynthesis polyprenyl glycosylphosphotransferase